MRSREMRVVISKTAETIQVTIFIAGDFNDAKRVCRKFCAEGLCVTVEPLTFVYTGGAEDGVRVGLINYPRFPATAAALIATAERLGDALREGLCQSSYSIVGPSGTIFKSWREADASPGAKI